MTDEEFLADVTAQNTYDITREEFERLVGLARIGTALKPRPIETAPKDGTIIWGWLNDMGWRKLVWLNSVVRAEYNGWTVDEETEPCWAMESDYGDDDWEPKFFIPLSALPTPIQL